ncbi:hypothetical protein GCM10010347_28310 [Streptomyces cirratus]|uniref:DUF72 domain-containing protein n=1 Tax=Streptomyces cirratus TaxID=68187 RepID=A0ABQ3EWL5_9ACTN|nr:DUF72 domain-containing protein [Streptomyces cirratus]GHB56562.1 hypothetical protein GCM10010347_28310 [Streptomyces cirratus]
MGEVLVGTCSWTDKALVGSGWYPPGRRDPEGRLRYYAERFPVVEVDAGYYALPSLRNSTLWAERTPPGFRFDVKAFSLLTGHPTRKAALPADLRGYDSGDPELLDEVWHRFGAALRPLAEAGRLGAVLFQFPPWFTPGARAEAVLHRIRKRAPEWPVAVEFRHPDWWRDGQRERTEALLKDLDATAVAVDTAPELPTSIPPVTPVTSPELAVVRFHGRSPAWGTGSKEDRFRHTYTQGELSEWLPRLRTLADRVEQLHVLFNNCCGDAAVRAAQTMRDLLALREGADRA